MRSITQPIVLPKDVDRRIEINPEFEQLETITNQGGETHTTISSEAGKETGSSNRWSIAAQGQSHEYTQCGTI